MSMYTMIFLDREDKQLDTTTLPFDSLKDALAYYAHPNRMIPPNTVTMTFEWNAKEETSGT